MYHSIYLYNVHLEHNTNQPSSEKFGALTIKNVEIRSHEY